VYLAAANPSRSLPAPHKAFAIWDVLLVAASFLGAHIFVSSWAEFQLALAFDPVATLGPLAVVVLLVVVVLRATLPGTRFNLVERFQQISLSLGVGFLGQALLAYAGAGWRVDFQVMLIGGGACAMLLIVWYVAVRVLFPGYWASPKVLLIEPDACVEEAAAILEVPPVRCAATADPRTLLRQIQESQPDRIVFPAGKMLPNVPVEKILSLRAHNVIVEDAARFCESMLERVCSEYLQPGRVLFGGFRPMRRKLATQAIYSNLCGMVLLVPGLPVMLLLFLALKLAAPRQPAIVGERCAGLYGMPFWRVRFHEGSPVGRLLVRTGLAGLPQLLNAVRGEMSLFGPRPVRMEFHEVIASQIPYFSERLEVRPGMMGWAQVHYPGLDILREVEYDLYYGATFSPTFDIRILLTPRHFTSRRPDPLSQASA